MGKPKTPNKKIRLKNKKRPSHTPSTDSYSKERKIQSKVIRKMIDSISKTITNH